MPRGGLISILFLCLIFAAELRSEPSEDELTVSGVNHFQQMLERFPPDKYHIIGLGPTVVVHSAAARAILGEQWDKYFSELPVAYFNEFEVLEPSVRKSLLPSKEVVAGRDVVVFRVLMTGASMRHYLPDFADLLKEEGITKNVEGYFISSSEISADEPFFSDWAESRTGELPKVTLVQDNDFASWLNSRDLNDTSKTIHGQTYFQQVGLDMLEEPVKFERNPASELIDRKVQLMTKQPTKSEACGYFRNLSDAERKTDSTRYHLSM